ncbi:Diphthine methyltransferase [Conglomerata obtusa]
MNMSLDINDDTLFVSQEDGNVTQYTLDLIPVNIIKICDHILWICKSYKKYIFAGCDCGKFIIYDILSKSVIKEFIRGSGITSIYVKDNLLYVGGYDEFVFIYEINTFEEIQRKYIGGGIWRILNYEEQFIIACMYEGYKILDCELNIIKHNKTPGITYAIDYNEKIFVHSSFYEKEIKIYKN